MMIILFTDMEASTAMTQKLGDDAAHRLVETHDQIVHQSLAKYRGRVVKHTGDGIMAAFRAASSAVKCAITIQQEMLRYSHEKRTNLRISIGISAGEPIIRNNDLFGTSVQLAARICNQAQGGEILVAEVVKHLLVGKQYDFTDYGKVPLKGFSEPIRLHAVNWS